MTELLSLSFSHSIFMSYTAQSFANLVVCLYIIFFGHTYGKLTENIENSDLNFIL